MEESGAALVECFDKETCSSRNDAVRDDGWQQQRSCGFTNVFDTIDYARVTAYSGAAATDSGSDATSCESKFYALDYSCHSPCGRSCNWKHSSSYSASRRQFQAE